MRSMASPIESVSSNKPGTLAVETSLASRTGGIVARIVTTLLIILVPAMIGLICWRWANVHVPSTAVVIAGDMSLNGAVVEVTGAGSSALER